MKVILLEKINPGSSLGDVVNVRPGYARNYLFPQGKAELASEEAIKRFEAQRAELQKRQEALEAAMAAAQQALSGYLLQLTARASPDGNLYGSITPQMIAAALNAQKLAEEVQIKRGQVSLPGGQIKSLGEHAASIRLGAAAQVDITVSVLAEKSSAPAAASTAPSTSDSPPSTPQETASHDDTSAASPPKAAQ